MSDITYLSSLRSRSTEETIEIAKRVAELVGITRVTDTTRLDRLGVPVYASIRPGAAQGSLCVSAGKGFTDGEAKAGAYMEAIELAYAEYGRAPTRIVWAQPDQLLDGRPESILDFCPVRGARIDLAEPIPCVEAEDLRTGRPALVPADVVFFPWPDLGAPHHFASDGNGLCSGNTVDEATVHGLAELIERDVWAFQRLDDRAVVIDPATFPEPIASLHRRMDALGFDLLARHSTNEFGIAHVQSILSDRSARHAYHTGVGCHPHRMIALCRAVTETFQSRLTMIHGGRDILPLEYRELTAYGPTVEAMGEFFGSLLDRLLASERMSWGDVPDLRAQSSTVADALALLLGVLERQGFRHAFRYVLSPPDLPVKVVRVVVPRLEIQTGLIKRMGPRLRKALHDRKRDDVRRADPAPGAGDRSD